MIYSTAEETNILKRTITSFRSRKEIKEYFKKYDIEFNKAKFNKLNIKRYRNIEELLREI